MWRPHQAKLWDISSQLSFCVFRLKDCKHGCPSSNCCGPCYVVPWPFCIWGTTQQTLLICAYRDQWTDVWGVDMAWDVSWQVLCCWVPSEGKNCVSVYRLWVWFKCLSVMESIQLCIELTHITIWIHFMLSCLSTQVQSNQHAGDDTSVNGIGVICQIGDSRKEIQSHAGQ